MVIHLVQKNKVQSIFLSQGKLGQGHPSVLSNLGQGHSSNPGNLGHGQPSSTGKLVQGQMIF